VVTVPTRGPEGGSGLCGGVVAVADLHKEMSTPQRALRVGEELLKRPLQMPDEGCWLE